MPFTFSHAVVAFPLKKKFFKYFSLLGLILGSMGPDFLYFINLKPSGHYGHTFFGFIILNIPLCLLINYIFIKNIRDSLIAHLPERIQVYFCNCYKEKTDYSLKGMIIFCYSALLGMITHVFWDSFTHKSGYFVDKFSFFQQSLHILNYNIPVYKILQHGSTIIGAVIIVTYILKGFFKNNFISTNISIPKLRKSEKVIYFLKTVLIMILFMLVIYLIGNLNSIGGLVVCSINGLFIGLYISSLTK
ncbi:DUF4184 family protein [Oceanirhabdus sp. W0125-5]|uniref:DUF4184 family protein n=1 Tax=Oceanirhabdus sp. W0125-5 TaxID=2999116 RepID=UPI0022F2FF5A|nr:DUF4184 family protein [Oceanirhabdus sp. W0125-5]WBW96565.1 DUF4184 family protein [Oceanirhabdus sp. W0125-5]